MADQIEKPTVKVSYDRDWDNSHFPAAWTHVIEASDDVAELRRARLAEIIEAKIIPQLRLSNGFESNSPAPRTFPNVSDNIGELADLVIRRDAEPAINYFRTLVEKGFALEYLFRELLGPTARRLGELWDEDINTMLDVTQGLSHLQQLVRCFGVQYHDEGGNPLLSRCALLMPLPGEQHSFGITLVEEYFRREGWQVWAGPPGSMKEVISLVKTMWFDIVGFSASQLTDCKKLARDLRSIRNASTNKAIVILVGGFAFTDRPELVQAVGADATAADARQAVETATKMSRFVPAALLK